MTGNAIVRPDGAPPFAIDKKAVLKYLNLSPDSVEAVALILVCQRYALDPLLNECRIVKNQPYITRDGMIKIAHRSGVFDGLVTEEERSSENGWSATVSVWRKDMSHPFTYKGGCGKAESQARDGHGAEMALARAERRALRRAFAIPAYDDIDDPVIDDTPRVLAPSPVGEPPAPTVESPPVPGRGGTTSSSSADHLLLDPRTAKDGHFVCTCGEIYPTLWGFQAHRTAMLEGPPVAVSGRAGTSVEHRTIPSPQDRDGMLTCSCGHREQTAWGMSVHRKTMAGEPPDEIYDQAPESRGDIDDLQPASYDDPGRPFT